MQRPQYENEEDMTIANKITVLRIILVPVFIVFTIPDATWARFVAASIFALACATDPLDGYFARSRSEVSVLGTFLDPLADKLLTMSAFVVMVKYQIVAAWMAIIIVGREVTITGLRAIVSQQVGAIIPANRWGGENKDIGTNGRWQHAAFHDPVW
jgi:CDP-diacylglycerol--glycerol-3-phosphate 3-phosphatidyltransferase